MMKGLMGDILFSVCMGMVLPGMVVNFCVGLMAEREEQTVTAPSEYALPHIPLPVLVRQENGEIRQTDMDEYLLGVVLAEMPASFEPEALKAQAVVARTYAWKAWVTGGKHGDGSVCKESQCCQGFRDGTDYMESGGREEDIRKIRSAVEETSGQVLTYEGDLIEATYFSCSGGRTEDAAAVWGADYPYLRSVNSPGEEAAAHYSDTFVFTKQQLETGLEIRLEEDPKQWTGQIRLTEGGGVDRIRIGDREFRGTEVRAALSLPSAAFSVSVEEGALKVITRGYGHRVGMSQYGADAMAVAGEDYRQILSHYYPGTELLQLGGETPDS